MVNMEDAIKVAGLEGEMEAIDLVELIDQHIIKEGSSQKELVGS